jgi:polyisoprenyl-phosphate glycosyltransferase
MISDTQISEPIEAPLVSVVLPCFNETGNLQALITRLIDELSAHAARFEVVCVDDGSTDDTAAQIARLSAKDSRVKLVRLARNFGKEIALSAGLDYARGDAVVLMDADMQHPPEVIPRLLEKWRIGFDMVVATRVNATSESFLRNWLTNIFYSLFAHMSQVTLTPNAGDFRLLDRRAVICLQALPERTRFLKGLYEIIGLTRVSIDYEVQDRLAGKTSFSARRLWRYAIDGLTSFTSWPLRVWSYVGMALAIPAAIYAVAIVFEKFVFGIDAPGYASLATMIAFFSGIQLFGLGVFGEYLARVFEESKRRPLYIVSGTIGTERIAQTVAHGGIELPARPSKGIDAASTGVSKS